MRDLMSVKPLLGAVVAAASFLSFQDCASAAPLVIDNADDLAATWVIGGTAVSHSTGTGLNGSGSVLTYDPNGATGTLSTLTTSDNIAGNRSAYKAGSLELDYRTLGRDVSGSWVPTAGYPRFLDIKIIGGSSGQYSINYGMLLWSSSGLGWDANSNWHTVVLALPQYDDAMAAMTLADARVAIRDQVRPASLFDGAAATTLTLPTIVLSAPAAELDASTGAGLNDLLNNLWANVQSIQVGVYTHLGTEAGVDTSAVSFDNLRIVPEPASFGLLAAGALLFSRRRRIG